MYSARSQATDKAFPPTSSINLTGLRGVLWKMVVKYWPVDGSLVTGTTRARG